MIFQEIENEQTPLALPLSYLTKLMLGHLSGSIASARIDKYFFTLLLIGRGKGKITQQMLCEYLHIDKASMVRIINYLIKAGTVEKKQNPADKREYFLSTTAEGKALLPKIRKAISKTNKDALENFSPEETEKFYFLLSRMYCNLSKLPADTFFINFQKIRS